MKLSSSVKKVELGNHTTEWKVRDHHGPIEDTFDTASGQENRLLLAALNTIGELQRVVKNDQPPRLNLVPLRKKKRTPCLIDSNN